MNWLLISVIALVALALLFDFSNGFHDAANSIATVVATKAMSARTAVWFAAFFNFLAYFFVSHAVANTVAKTVKKDDITIAVIFAALLSALVWNYLTWFLGMPSSSSHAIIGGLVGAGLAVGGADAISWASVQKVGIALILSPLVAGSIGALATVLLRKLSSAVRLGENSKVFQRLQLVSAASLSFGHGANDAQKTMGVIAALLAGSGYLAAGADGKYAVPTWVALAAYSAIALGTAWGGWRIIATMGMRITPLNPRTAVAANIGAVTAIFGATHYGAPISTTHAAASSVIGVGTVSGRGLAWRVVGEMGLAWVITIPSTTLLAFLFYWMTQLPGVLGAIVTGGVVILVGGAIVWAMMNSKRDEELDAGLPIDAPLATSDRSDAAAA